MTAVPASASVDHAPAVPALADVLAHRRWVRRQRPFPHVVAQDVFVPSFHRALTAAWRRIETEQPHVFERSMTGYDASGTLLDRFRDGPLGIFVSREWHDLLAGLFGVTATGDMTASLHHHDPGGASGWPHHDVAPGWFADPPAGPGEVRLPLDGQVGYHRGERPDGVTARETVRAVSALYYLANPDWRPGHGGETALLSAGRPDAPGVTVPPVDNSLVVFECTPWSWHTYLANRVTARNSVVMWVHRTKDEVLARWGDDVVAYW